MDLKKKDKLFGINLVHYYLIHAKIILWISFNAQINSFFLFLKEKARRNREREEEEEKEAIVLVENN